MGSPKALWYKMRSAPDGRHGYVNVDLRKRKIFDTWLGFSQSPEKQAMEAAFDAFLETKAGKTLKDLLTRKKVLPFTLIAAGPALAGWLLAKKDFPTASLPLGSKLSEKIAVEVKIIGNVQQIRGVTVSFYLPLGAVEKKKPESKAKGVTGLPPKIASEIRRRLKDDLVEWILAKAFWQYETAGPDEEPQKQAFYIRLRDDKDSLPTMYDWADALALQILRAARQKQTMVRFELGHPEIWPRLHDYPGLFNRLNVLGAALSAILGSQIGTVTTITFVYAGKKHRRNNEDIKWYPVRLRK